MLLVIDVGNTNIKTGLFDNGKLFSSWRLHTNLRATSDEYGIQMEGFFRHLKLDTSVVDGIIMSSVIPSINFTMEHMVQLYFPQNNVLQVSDKLDLPINIKYDQPSLLGADRICNSVAAFANYGGPSVVIDFGTATSFSVISEAGDFVGGLICPGVIVASEALTERAAMLQKVEYIKPEHVICTNTKDAVQSGIINATVGQVEYILRKIDEELGERATVIVTGGMSSLIAEETDMIDYIDPTLTLKGLMEIYKRNQNAV